MAILVFIFLFIYLFFETFVNVVGNVWSSVLIPYASQIFLKPFSITYDLTSYVVQFLAVIIRFRRVTGNCIQMSKNISGQLLLNFCTQIHISIQRGIQNHVKHLGWKVLQKQLTALAVDRVLNTLSHQQEKFQSNDANALVLP